MYRNTLVIFSFVLCYVCEHSVGRQTFQSAYLIILFWSCKASHLLQHPCIVQILPIMKPITYLGIPLLLWRYLSWAYYCLQCVYLSPTTILFTINMAKLPNTYLSTSLLMFPSEPSGLSYLLT